MSKLDELVDSFSDSQCAGCRKEALRLIRAYIEARFGPLMRDAESTIQRCKKSGFIEYAAEVEAGLRRAKQEGDMAKSALKGLAE